MLLHSCLLFPQLPTSRLCETKLSKPGEPWTPERLQGSDWILSWPSSLPSHFRPETQRPPPPYGSGFDPQQSSLLIRLPLSPGFNFPSFFPTHTPCSSTKISGRGPLQTISPTHNYCEQSPRLLLTIYGAFSPLSNPEIFSGSTWEYYL